MSAGGAYTPIHIDFPLLAQLVYVIAKEGAMKLILMFPPNQNNLSLMFRRHRNESPLSWESGKRLYEYELMVDISQFTGLQIAILKHGNYLIMPEGMLHTVLTVGTAGNHLFGPSDFSDIGIGFCKRRGLRKD